MEAGRLGEGPSARLDGKPTAAIKTPKSRAARSASPMVLQLLRLQSTAGNRATASLVKGGQFGKLGKSVQREVDSAQEASIKASYESTVAKGREELKAGGDGESSGESGTSSGAPRARPDPAVMAAKKAEVRGAMAQPDTTAQPRAQVESTAADTKAEAAKPPEGGVAAPTGPAAGGTPEIAPAADATSAANAQAQEAFAMAQAQDQPEEPQEVVVPEPVPEPVDAGGAPLRPHPDLDVQVAALGGKSALLRRSAYNLRVKASAIRAQAHQLRGAIASARGGVAQSTQSVTTVKGHVTQRREASGKAKAALSVSEQKAEMVASQAPEFAAKGEEGEQTSGPMAAETGELAAQSRQSGSEDAEASSKSQEQSSKLGKVSGDIRSVHTGIAGSKTTAQELIAQSAQAKQKNTETKSKVAETDTTLDQADGKLEQMTGQNAAAAAKLSGLANRPANLLAGAAQLDEEAQSLTDASAEMEGALHQSQTTFASDLKSVPAVAPPPEGPSVARSIQRDPLPVPPAAPGTATGSMAAAGVSTGDGYGDRTNFGLSEHLAGFLGSTVSGQHVPNAAERAEAQRLAREKHAANLADINARCNGHFERLSTGDKMGIALEHTVGNLWGDLKSTNWANFTLTLLRGFIDPRVSIMGIVAGLSMIGSGLVNLFSWEQMKRDWVLNVLKSAADITTGITILLGSIVGLALAIIVILGLLSIFGIGIPFATVMVPICTKVAAVLGPITIKMAIAALILHGAVLIKNLISAGSASTAEQLEQNTDRMTADAKGMGSMLMIIGMAKGGKAVGLGKAYNYLGNSAVSAGEAAIAANAGAGGGGGGGGTQTGGGGNTAPTTEGPAPTTEGPAPTTEGPAPTTEGPAPTTEGPAPTTEGPAPTTEGPAPTTEGPAPTTEGPAPTTEGPAPTTEGPAPTTEGPGTEGPATEGPATEGPGTEGPATEGPEPTTEGPEPTTEGPEPTTEEPERIPGPPGKPGGQPVSPELQQILDNPQLLEGVSPEEVEARFGSEPNWRIEALLKGSHKGGGFSLREISVRKGGYTGRMLRWNPGGTRKNIGPYWRVTNANGQSDPIRAGESTSGKYATPTETEGGGGTEELPPETDINVSGDQKAALIAELQASGVKVTPENVVRIGRNAAGKIIFLESGTSKAGLQHIVERHAGEFADNGVSEAQIPDVVMRAALGGRVVGMQNGRPILEINVGGRPLRVIVTIASNGFIVGANPTTAP